MASVAYGTLVSKGGTLDLKSDDGRDDGHLLGVGLHRPSGWRRPRRDRSARQDRGSTRRLRPGRGRLRKRRVPCVRRHHAGPVVGHRKPPGPGSVIDGFKLGAVLECSPPIGSPDPSLAGSSCAGQPALALAALDARDPGHQAVIATTMYSDGTQPRARRCHRECPDADTPSDDAPGSARHGVRVHPRGRVGAGNGSRVHRSTLVRWRRVVPELTERVSGQGNQPGLGGCSSRRSSVTVHPCRRRSRP